MTIQTNIQKSFGSLSLQHLLPSLPLSVRYLSVKVFQQVSSSDHAIVLTVVNETIVPHSLDILVELIKFIVLPVNHFVLNRLQVNWLLNNAVVVWSPITLFVYWT